MIIGITGGTGCGKTTALDAIRALGGVVLDCDEIYHHLLQTDSHLLSTIEHRFPGCVTEGVLNRKALGAVVFSDKAALQDLNSITHSAVKEVVLSELAKKPSLVAIDAIGLFESGLADLCDVTVAISAPEESRITRLMARDNITAEYARMRIQAQRPQAEFIALCDHHLANDATAQQFKEQCLAFFHQLAIIKENQKGELL